MEDVTGQRITRQLVFDLVDSFAMEQCTIMANEMEKARLLKAVQIFKELVTAREPPLFLTTYLNNHSSFLAAQQESNLSST